LKWRGGSKVIDLLSNHPGLGFYLYGLIVFIIAVFAYVGYLRTSLFELSFYITISTAIGTTLQLISTISASLKILRALRDQPLLTRLTNSNLGIFFYGYSIVLLYTSIPTYLLRDYGTYVSLTQFGIISTLIGLTLHVASNMLSTGRRNLIPTLFAMTVATIFSTTLFYNILVPLPLKPLPRILISSGYFTILTLSYLATLNITGSVLAGFSSMILMAISPATIKLAKSGDYSLIIFSTTYIALLLLIFYLREIRLAIPLTIIVLTIQAFFSEAYLLSIILAIITIIHTFLKERGYYIVYTSLFTSLVIFFYILIYSRSLLEQVFKICNIYYITSLTLSAYLSILLLLERDTMNPSKTSTVTIPLLLGVLFFFKESYTTLICMAILISSFLTTYLPKSITINKANDEEIEITLILDKFLAFTPIILLLVTSVIE